MRYLIIIKDPETGVQEAFYSTWYNYTNLYSAMHEMVVVDLIKVLITYNGYDWDKIERDHL